MWISQAAREAGVNAQTLRWDERRVRASAERTIEDTDRRIAHLPSMRGALDQLVESCRHGGATDSPIIDALNLAPGRTQ
ncbi:MAG: hypothetical protein ACRD2I_07360 [Vicinamibacterales bacterium]